MGYENNIPTPENSVEKIVGSAIRFQEEVFTGTTHIDALMEMEETFPDWSELEGKPEDGFVTSTGRFVERDEAGEIAKNAGQLDHLSGQKRENAGEYLDAHDIEEFRPKWLK